MIRNGMSEELDKLRNVVKVGKSWISQLEHEEKERTGISSLKIGFNQVFGFYIDISKANLHNVPRHYIRKQTLVNGERFITEELKKQEEKILIAEEKMCDLEYSFFQNILEEIMQKVPIIQEAAQQIAILDCLTNFAAIAVLHQYSRPKMLYSGEIQIKDGRHPVVEQLLPKGQFVPNDLTINNLHQSMLLLTGPNMAGKSVLIRQVALIVLMAQIGSFVPARQAYISIVDRIFVRSGASDVITSGLSTFMVEMVETAYILHNATEKSLIVMDEIGRGTSTYDGISIAWAVAEYLVTQHRRTPKTLFATHYHELQELEKQYTRKIKNYHMAVEEKKGQPIFLYTFLEGGASHSFGVAVAKLAGIPQPVITRALILLHKLEQRHLKKAKSNNTVSTIQDGEETLKILSAIDIKNITPLEALNQLSKLQEMHTGYKKHGKN